MCFRRLADDSGRLKRAYEIAAATLWLPVQSPRGLLEFERIADEQGAMRTATPPSWLPVPGGPTALREADVSLRESIKQ